MVTKVFITGASGYLGGTILAQLATHPSLDLDILVLARRKESERAILDAFPTVNTLLGDINDASLIANVSERADIVIHNALSSDHPTSLIAIMEGLGRRSQTSYFIFTSGTAILTFESFRKKDPGNFTDEKIWSDVDDEKALTFQNECDIPDDFSHRPVEKALFAVCARQTASSNIHVAVVSPPTLFGLGSGPEKRSSLQIPALIQGTIASGSAFCAGEGRNIWSAVHVEDAARFYVLLVEKAVRGDYDMATWGENAYYFLENGSYAARDLSSAVGQIAYEKGLISNPAVKLGSCTALRNSGVNASDPSMAYFWYSNSRCNAEKARRLGWKAHEGTVFESLVQEVDMGLWKGAQLPEIQCDK